MRKSAIAFAAVMLTATLGFAQQGEGRRGPQDFATMYGEKLTLTDAQKDQIKTIEAKTREENKEFFDATRKLMDAMRAARDANDQAKMDALKPEMKANREKMMTIREAEMGRIKTVLTADQRTALEKIQAEQKAQREAKRQQ